jgi:hypothetical protein
LYDIVGKKLYNVVDGYYNRGVYKYMWDAIGVDGGVYILE